jgi:uncharacterized protein YdhG (YjbR/CyaY superfamily)
MHTTRAAPQTIDGYIAHCPPDVQAILHEIRRVINTAAPGARETISYRMPTFMLNGVLVYVAAFKHHIGLYPPVAGDARLVKALSPYRGEKGNLRFPLHQPIPYDLIERIVMLRMKRNLAKATTKARATTKAKKPAAARKRR